MNWVFYVIAFIAALFVAVCISQMIMRPIKQKREERRWQRAKAHWAKEFSSL
jgi:hypothetical protein